MSGDTRASARAFVRSLNILLKFARLYEFGHARTAAQFETTWKELRSALDESAGSGLLLGASGTQILLDGVPLGTAAGERSFANLLITSGIASIHFAPSLPQAQFARFVRAFPSGNAKPLALAEQLKSALSGDHSIKINEIRYVAEDSSVAGIKVAAQLTAKVLGAQGDKFRDFLDDPNKLLQMILAAESNRGPGGGGPGAGSGSGSGGLAGGGSLWEGSGGAPTGGGGLSGTGSGIPRVPVGAGGSGDPGAGRAAGGGVEGKWLTASALLRASMGTSTEAGAPGALGGPGGPGGFGGPGGQGEFGVAEEDIRSMLGLFAQLGRTRKDPESRMEVPTFQSRLSALPVRAQYTLQQALAGLAAQAPSEGADKPMLLKLAEHVAIRFALDSYERGELRVNAVRQLLDRMNAEIEGLRKILGSQEQMMASAGLQVQSYTELLDQEFWEHLTKIRRKC